MFCLAIVVFRFEFGKSIAPGPGEVALIGRAYQADTRHEQSVWMEKHRKRAVQALGQQFPSDRPMTR
nr:hypothetical protein pPsy0462a_00111 [Pseudomonas syringae]